MEGATQELAEPAAQLADLARRVITFVTIENSMPLVMERREEFVAEADQHMQWQ